MNAAATSSPPHRKCGSCAPNVLITSTAIRCASTLLLARSVQSVGGPVVVRSTFSSSLKLIANNLVPNFCRAAGTYRRNRVGAPLGTACHLPLQPARQKGRSQARARTLSL